jgi:tRNA G10  N-methylase Trm11
MLKSSHIVTSSTCRAAKKNGETNKLSPEDAAAHRWYRFVLSFPPHLVRHYLDKFGIRRSQRVLDPFCGTGTTIVECKKLGVQGVGIEANPMAFFATSVKIDWTPDPSKLVSHAEKIADAAASDLSGEGITDEPDFFSQSSSCKWNSLRSLSAESVGLLLKDSLSPLPMHKALVLLNRIQSGRTASVLNHERLAFATAIVSSASNLHFGPEVGVRRAKQDASVIAPWLVEIDKMATDIRALQTLQAPSAELYLADARDLRSLIPPRSIDAVITSPPYPNEKDYTRTTRLESVLLGFLNNRSELRFMKQGLIRSNTRNVYKTDMDDQWVTENKTVQRIADRIEARRVELGKTSGFERLYPRVTRLYFGGMARHLSELQHVLRPGARLAYVVGDQASYLRVMIRTGQLLAEIAESLGYEVVGIDLFRERAATATKAMLREEVVILRWPGQNGAH